MGARRAVLGVVVPILLAGCASTGGAEAGSDAEQPSDPSSNTSTPTPTPTPSGSATPSPSATPTGPEGGIPADLLLPGHAGGQVEPRTDAGRLYDYICLDPPHSALGTGFTEAQTVIHRSDTGDGAATIEKLAAYASEVEAAGAVRGLRTQVDLCGEGVDHVGNPKTWRAVDLTSLPSTDEALQLTYRSEGDVSTVVTVVRVGRAVYYIDRREQHDDGVPADERTVAGFVPTLAAAFR